MAEATQAQLPHVNFTRMVYEIPTVSSAWGYAFNVYEKAKGYNPLVEKTLNKAESTAKAVVNQVIPITSHFKAPIELVDTLACKGLFEIENKLPVIKLPPEEILSTTKSYVNNKLEPAKHYGTEKMEQLKTTAAVVGQYGYSTANVVLSTKIGHLALDSVDAFLDVAENYVDHYLPIKEAESKDEDGSVESKELEPPVKVAYSVRRALKISQKTYRGALEKLHSAQLTTKALTQHLDILQLAHHLNPSAVRDQAQAFWAAVLKEEEEVKEGVKNTEQLAVTVARQLARRLMGVYSSAYTTFQGVPAHLKRGFDDALKQAEDVYSRIVKATHMEAFSDSMITQVKSTLAQLHKTLGGLQHLALTWLDGFVHKPDAQPRPEENGFKDQANHQDDVSNVD